MRRWRLTVHESSGRALITLLDVDRPVGVFNVSVSDYEGICKILMNKFAHVLQNTLFQDLHKELWQRAQRASHEDHETAIKKLIELGWSLDNIKEFVNNITVSIVGTLLSDLQ